MLIIPDRWGKTGSALIAVAKRPERATRAATSQATAQVMNRFLNRLPTITIREGHRVKVYRTADIDMPAYEPAGLSDRQ